MFKYNDYVMAESLKQAYELNQKKSNVILGGTGWLKMQDRQMGQAIDLSSLGLDKIVEDDEKFTIGCMASLRDIELHKGLNEYTGGSVKESVRHIVGTQFRNTVTVGGSIYGRFGFSDVLTMFLALDSYVELYKGGIIPLEEYSNRDYDRDILVNIIVKKRNDRVVYTSFRNQSTDFPVLTCAISENNGEYSIVIGARPARAKVLHDKYKLIEFLSDACDNDKNAVEKYSNWAAEQFTYGSNMRASEEYRKTIAAVLIKRCLGKLI